MKEMNFKPEDKLEKWEDIEPYFNALTEHSISGSDDLQSYIKSAGHLGAFIDEKIARAYIDMTCNTENKKFVKLFQILTGEISPKVEEAYFTIEKKIADSPYTKDLPEKYNLLLKRLKTSLELYRENNLNAKAEESVITSQYDQLTGSIMVNYQGEEYTLSQMSKFLETDNPEERENAWKAIAEKQYTNKNDLSAVFDRLFSLRNLIARNADFENYRDYMFKAKQRFDYTPEDCFTFHESVEKEIVPLVAEINQYQRKRLGVKELFPWDMAGIPKGEKPLKPFETADELLEKTIKVYTRLRPSLGKNLETMKKHSLFDLASRKGKAPGGYNYPLALTNMPFIFMNAVGSQKDVRTILHEGGHATHNFQTADMELYEYKSTPSESAELASMSMELITMDFWDEFYPDKEELKRAKREQLESVITLFPWVMIVDAIQHWIYTHPEHTPSERDEKFIELLKKYDTGMVNWTGLEKYKAQKWIYQLHITTVPFYYIEYAIAQLGALQIWKNYKQKPDKALDDYLTALSLGSSRTLPEVYQAAGIEFNFSAGMIKDLMNFTKTELAKLQ